MRPCNTPSTQSAHHYLLPVKGCRSFCVLASDADQELCDALCKLHAGIRCTSLPITKRAPAVVHASQHAFLMPSVCGKWM